MQCKFKAKSRRGPRDEAAEVSEEYIEELRKKFNETQMRTLAKRKHDPKPKHHKQLSLTIVLVLVLRADG